MNRPIPKLEPVTTPIADVIDVDVYLNSTDEEWDAIMKAKYGEDWQDQD